MKRLLLLLALVAGSVLMADEEPAVRAAFLIDGKRVEGEYHDEGGIRTICTEKQCLFVPEDAVRLDLETGEPLAEKPVAETSVATPDETPAETPVETPTDEVRPESVRMIQGLQGVPEFLSFLNGETVQEGGTAESSGDAGLGEKAWYIVLLLAFFGGFVMNLTPCVLPMIPINLMIIGKSAGRGALYGLGIAVSYGLLGLLAAVGGMAFGEIQGNPWFNLVVALLFLGLSLSLFGVFMIDFSKHRKMNTGGRKGLLFPLVMGCVSAVLAGACVAPILVAVLLLTARLYAGGSVLALGLPFVMGLGMALPWPFVGAGLKVLPKPGAWMAKVNKLFGLVVVGFACWYGYLAFVGFRGAQASTPSGEGAAGDVLTIDSPKDFTLDGLKRPVLVDCRATWCKNCTAMEHTTLADPAVVARLRDFTVVELQCEKMGELVSHPDFVKAQEVSGQKILGLPTFVIFE